MGQQYSLMDQGRAMNHGTANGFGGAMTFLNVWATAAAPDTCAPDVPGPPPTPETTTTTSTTTIAPETTISTTTTVAPTTTIYIPVTTNPGGGGGGGEPEPEPETKSTVAKSSTTVAAAPPIALPSRGSAVKLISGVKIMLSSKDMSFRVQVPGYSPTPISKYKFVVATSKTARVFRQGTVKAAAPLKYTTWTTRNLSVGTYSLSVYAMTSTGKVLEVFTENIDVQVDTSKAMTVTQQLTPRAITPKVIIHASGVFQK
jgi:hypothetical protein